MDMSEELMHVWDRYRDKRIVYQSSIRAARYGISSSFTLAEWLELCAQHDNKCAHCGQSVPLSADHIIPLSRGGANTISNIQPLCKPCNSRKHAKFPVNGGEERGDMSLIER